MERKIEKNLKIIFTRFDKKAYKETGKFLVRVDKTGKEYSCQRVADIMGVNKAVVVRICKDPAKWIDIVKKLV